jgi:hypothetical protein
LVFGDSWLKKAVKVVTKVVQKVAEVVSFIPIPVVSNIASGVALGCRIASDYIVGGGTLLKKNAASYAIDACGIALGAGGKYAKAGIAAGKRVLGVVAENALKEVGEQATKGVAKEIVQEAAEAAAKRGGIWPVLKGRAGVERAMKELEGEGLTVVNTNMRQATIETGGRRIRPDIITRDVDGNIGVWEVKNGRHAGLSGNQRAGYGSLETQGGTWRGKVAESFDLSGQTGKIKYGYKKYE